MPGDMMPSFSLHRVLIACLSGVAVVLSPAAFPVTVSDHVLDQDGRALPDAAVYAVPLNGKLPAAHPAHAVIDQIKRKFVPLVSVIQTGTSLSFPNKDNIEHDVYSFSP